MTPRLLSSTRPKTIALLALVVLMAFPVLVRGQTPGTDIFEAIATGKLSLVKDLVEKKKQSVNQLRVVPVKSWAGMDSADPWEPEFQGKISPLVQAILADNVPLVQYLLSRGADPNVYVTFQGVRDQSLGTWESSALFAAVERGDPRMVKILLDGGADPGQKVRYYGGPMPPLPPSTEPDRSLFGAPYYKDSRARIGIMDLLMTPGFRNSTSYQLILKKSPRLRPEYHLYSLYYAAIKGQADAIESLMAEGKRLDRDGFTVLVRAGNQTGLETALAYQDLGFPGKTVPEGLYWSELAELCTALDQWWLNEVVGKIDLSTDFTRERAQAFRLYLRKLGNRGLADLADKALQTTGAMVQAFEALERPRLATERPQSKRSDGAYRPETLMLLEPWTQPWRGSPGKARGKMTDTLAGKALGELVQASFWGSWESRSPLWKLDIGADTIRNAGINAEGKIFDSWLHDWKPDLDEALWRSRHIVWPISYQTSEGRQLWVYLSHQSSGTIKVYNPQEEQSTVMTLLP